MTSTGISIYREISLQICHLQGSHFGLHLGKREAQCLEGCPEMLLRLLIFHCLTWVRIYIGVFTLMIHLVVYL